MEPLSAKQRKLLRSLATRHGRKKSGLCLCEGLRCVREVLQAAPAALQLLLLTEKGRAELTIPVPPGVTAVGVTEVELAEFTATVNSQGILAVAAVPEPVNGSPCSDPFIFALDQVGDPGNFGTMLRTARAAGLTELWYTEGCADPFGDKVIRSALGAQFSMRLRAFPNLAALGAEAKALHYDGGLCLSDPHQGEDCFTAPGLFDRTVIVIGSEANGIDPAEPGRRIMIPMPGKFESLNAAQAATILLFEAVRRSVPGRA